MDPSTFVPPPPPPNIHVLKNREYELLINSPLIRKHNDPPINPIYNPITPYNSFAQIDETEINEILLLFDDVEKAEINNYIQITTDYVEIRDLTPFIYKKPKYEESIFKLGIFNIYDDSNILNQSYGSDINIFYESGYKFIELLEGKNNIDIKDIPYIYDNSNSLIINELCALIEFFKPTFPHDSFILNFGSNFHSTCLYFKKLQENNIIQVTHINTGFGLDKSNYITKDDKTFYDLFNKTLYLSPELIPPFIKFLKPYIYFNNNDNDTNDNKMKYILNVLTNINENVLNYNYPYDDNLNKLFCYNYSGNLNKYYMEIFELFTTNPINIFHHLNKIFNLFDFEYMKRKIGITNVPNYYEIRNKYRDILSNNSFIFYNNLNELKSTYVADSYKTNYIKKSLHNFDMEYDSPQLYITAQSSGTCVFKSLLMSFIYHMIYLNDKKNKSLISDIYLLFSDYCYEKMNSIKLDSLYIEKACINQNINYSILMNHLIKDKIMPPEFSFKNIIYNQPNKDLPLNFKIYNNTYYNDYTFKVSTIPIVLLNNLVENIRIVDTSNDKQKNLKTYNDCIITYVKTTKYDDIHRSYCELFLLGMIWELYYNKSLWETKINTYILSPVSNYNISNILFLNILEYSKSRINFNNNEINWICKMYIYLVNNIDEINNSELIKNIYIRNYDIKEKHKLFKIDMLSYIKISSNKDKYITENNIDSICDHLFNSKPINPSSTSQNSPSQQSYDPNIIKPTIVKVLKYFNYIFLKNDLLDEKIELFEFISIDNDSFNLNRFIINHFKNETFFYIDLEKSFNLIKNDNNHYKKYNEDIYNNNNLTADSNNIYIMHSFIDTFKIYSVYLTDSEKYKILKAMFINCKPIINNLINIIVDKLLVKIIILLNIILPDVYLNFNNIVYMTYSIGKYNNIHDSYNLYDNGSDKQIIKTHLDIINSEMVLFMYKNILELFEQNKEITKNKIINIINKFNLTIDSPYFYIDETDSEYMNLVINNNIIKDKFNKVEDLYRLDNENNVRHFILGELLSNKLPYYINSNRTHLVYILYPYKYNNVKNIKHNMDNNIIIAFEILKGPTDDTIIITDNAYIHSNKIIFDTKDSLSLYPFMAFSSVHAINIIAHNNINYILHSISNSNNYMDSEFTNMIHRYNDNYYVSFKIKNNQLVPNLNIYTLKYLNFFYEIHNPLCDYVNNLINNSKSFINYDIIIENLPDMNTIENLTDKQLDFLDKILTQSNNDVSSMINIILKSTQVSYNDLVDWINKNTQEDTLKRYDTKLDCDLKCHIISKEPFKLKLKEINRTLSKLVKILYSKLNHNYSTYFEFLYANYKCCYYIMHCNIYIINIKILLDAIKTCKPLLCHELLEINQIFTKKLIRHEFNIKVPIICGIVEIIFGNIIKNEQWEIIIGMYNNYKNRATEKYQVHQIMMGKGKSSIITPALCSLLIYDNKDNQIFIVVPDHLKLQTFLIMQEYFLYIINDFITIISDSELKLKFLNNEIPQNSILLIDEFDYMYNPLQSNFNIIQLSEKIDNDISKKIFKIMHNILINKKTFTPSKEYSVISEINTILKDENNIKNVSYGMSIIYNYRYCIPYMRKDSPNEGSKFSSILYTMVLTILYFYNKQYNKYILEENDIKFIYENKQLLAYILRLFNINNGELNEILYQYKQIKITELPDIPYYIMELYIIYIFNDIKKSLIIQNCSFIDIINKDTVWQVGYSGTVNINMNIKELINDNKYSHNIIKDNDETINVKKALENSEDVHLINTSNIDYVFNLMIENNYHVLIDACALLKDYDNKEVAEILYNKFLSKRQKKNIIYLLKDDTKMIYNGSHNMYDGKIFNVGEVIYYYSQRHIIGIDFKQPSILNGLILINDNNIYTEIAQAIYRMRKLNKGHTIKIGYVSNTIKKSSEIYEMINMNEIKYNESNINLLLYQYLKYYVRKYYTKQYYEFDLNIFINNPTKETIFNKINHNIFSKLFVSDNKIVNKFIRKLIDYNKYKEFNNIPNDTIVKSLLKTIMNLDLDTLLKLVFNINSIQQDVSTEISTEVTKETTVEQQLVSSSSNNFNRLFRKVSFKYNPFRSLDEFISFNYLSIDLNNIKLILSYNLIKNINGKNYALIIKLNENNYLLDHASMFNYYCYNYPIYNLNGKLINYFVFKTQNKTTDFSKIFNYKLVNNTNPYDIIDIAGILFNIFEDINEIKNIVLSNEIITDFKILISLSNINIFNINYLNLTRIKSSTDLELAYINNHRIFNLNNTIIKRYIPYLMHFYNNISYKTNINENNIMTSKHPTEIRIKTFNELSFSFDMTNSSLLEYFQIMTN